MCALRIIELLSIGLALCILSSEGRPKQNHTDMNTFVNHDMLETCIPSFEMHKVMRNTNDDLRSDYLRVMNRVHKTNLQWDRVSGSLVEHEKIYTRLPEGEFVFWGMPERGILDFSAFNANTVIEGEKGNGRENGSQWRFVAPNDKDFSTIKKTIILDGDHLAFVAPNFEVFAHVFLDSIGYFAYLREVMPPLA